MFHPSTVSTSTARPRRASGVALLWAIMIIAMIAAIAAYAVPSLVQNDDVDRWSTTAQTVRSIKVGLDTFARAVQDGQKTSVHNLPGRFSLLANAIKTGDVNSCWNAMTIAIPSKGTTSDSITWVASGPFISFYFPRGGLWTPIGTIVDSVPDRGSTPNTTPLYLLISGVRSADVSGFDQLIDNGSGDTITTLHAAVNDTTTIRYRLYSTAQVTANIC
jgi:hypothetical protein